MPFDSEKRTYLVGLHGEEIVASIEGKADSLEKDLLSMGVEFKDMGIKGEDVDADKVTTDAVKAIVESDGFKAMIQTVADASKDVGEMKQLLPLIAQRLGMIEKDAKKTHDDIVADAFKALSAPFQASKDGKPPNEDEQKKEEVTNNEDLPIDRGLLEMVQGAIAKT